MKKWIAVALLAPLGAYACLPSDLGGQGTRTQLETNTNGVAVAWWCQGYTRPSLTLYAVRWSGVTPELRQRITAVGASSDKLAAIEQMRAASVNTALADLADVWQPMRERIAQDRPSLPIWVVAPAPSTASPRGTRPTYTLTGSTLMATGRRIDQDATCDCSRHFVQGTSTYCQVLPAPDMAVCTRIN